MSLAKRLAIAVAAMLIASLLVGTLWLWVFESRIPSYFSGVVGGLAALGVWELLRTK